MQTNKNAWEIDSDYKLPRVKLPYKATSCQNIRLLLISHNLIERNFCVLNTMWFIVKYCITLPIAQECH